MQTIGEGTHARVLLDSHSSLVWKIYNTDDDVPFPRIDALSEIDFLERMKHPNIPTMVDKVIYVKDGFKHFAVCMPYCGVPLTRELVEPMHLDVARYVLRQYFSALRYIHDLNILHCDIKEDNVLVDPEKGFKVSLIDFGLSVVIGTPKQMMLTSMMYTEDYKPPEIRNFERINPDKSMDIYASGAMLAFLGMTSLESPLVEHNPKDRATIDDIIRDIENDEWLYW